jgi:putative membrane protein
VTTATPATPATTEVDWRRLSVRMLLVHPVVESLRALPVIFGLLIVGSRSGGGGWWSLIGVGVAVALGLLRWATTRYRVTREHIEIQRGLVNRRVVTVPRDRVRSVDITAHVLHRVLGLVKVAVGTGESDRQRHESLVLDGMATGDAARLREELLHQRRPTFASPVLDGMSVPIGAAVGGPATAGPTTAGPPGPAVDAGAGGYTAPVSGPRYSETRLAKLSPAWILYGPFTLSGLVTVGVVLAFAWRTINEAHVNPERVGIVRSVTDELTAIPIGLAVVEVIIAAMIVIAVLSTLGYVLAFWNFSLTRNEAGTLHIGRGLLTTRATTIEERRLRGVELSEPLLLRAVGAARCIAITTGLRVGRGAERGGSLILPPAPRSEALRVGEDVLGQAAPLTTQLVGHPRPALRRRLTRSLFGAAVLIGLAGLLSWGVSEPVWVIGVAIVAVPLAILVGIDRYRSLGHAVVGHHVVFRLGSLVRRRSALSADGVIGFTLRQSFFQRRSGLVTLTATTAAGRQRYELLDVRAGTAVAIANQALPGILNPFLVQAQVQASGPSRSPASVVENG